MQARRRICWLPQCCDRQYPQIVGESQALLAEIKHHAARKFFAGSFGERAQAAEVALVHVCRGFDLDARDTLARRFEHQVHLLPGRRAKVIGRGAIAAARLKTHNWSFIIRTMDISVTQFKHHCLEIIRRLEQTGAPVAITRRGKVVAQLQTPPVSKSGVVQKPWERLRAMGGHLLADPGESVIRDKDFEALR